MAYAACFFVGVLAGIGLTIVSVVCFIAYQDAKMDLQRDMAK